MRTIAGLAAARARGRKGGRKFALTKAQIRVAQAAMANRDTSVSDLAAGYEGALDIEDRIDQRNGLDRKRGDDRHSATGLEADRPISTSTKNFLRPWAQHAASSAGPGWRSGA